MVRSTSRNSGFTLIELLVALVIVTVVAALAFFGLRQDNPNQLVNNAAREFLAKARSLQNQVKNGADGAAVKTLVIPGGTCSSPCPPLTVVVSYVPGVTPILTTTTFNVPAGVNVSSSAGAETTGICFTHPAVAIFDSTRMCFGNGAAGSECKGMDPGNNNVGFLCNMGYAYTPVTFYVEFRSSSNSNIYKRVVFEGSGMQISRMYVQ